MSPADRAALRATAHAVLQREVGAVVVARLCPRCGSGAHGRPLVRVSSGPAPHVSISYAEGLVAVAWSHAGPVGVDVELRGEPVDGIDRREWTEAEASFKADGDVRLRPLRVPEGYVGTVAGAEVSVRVVGPPPAPPHVQRLAEVGLGLDHEALELAVTTEAWLDAGAELRARVAGLIDWTEVAQVGSSSVLDLLAKPVVDLAVGLHEGADLAPVTAALEADGWTYRGDAGARGGHVFVLESRPWHRVAHLHVVRRDGRQWRDYLRLRDLLRSSAEARERYAAVKRRLARSRVAGHAYIEGKTDVVTALLAGPAAPSG